MTKRMNTKEIESAIDTFGGEHEQAIYATLALRFVEALEKIAANYEIDVQQRKAERPDKFDRLYKPPPGSPSRDFDPGGGVG